MKTMRVPILTGVTAGRGIPDDYTDWQISGFRDIRLIETADKTVSFALIPLEGDSLREIGIFDGDFAAMRITRHYEDNKIGIWQTPHGRTAKFAYYDHDGYIVLHNKHGWSQSWGADEIRLLGVVDRIERDV